jgi:hypothetical protein
MRTWNLSLRFGLEIGAITGLGWAAWNQTEGTARWAAAVPLAAAGAWGVFNVPDDPSRSGAAPVQVPGWSRLALELLIFTGGWIGYGIAGHPAIGVTFAAVTVAHYAVSQARVRWLLAR